MLKVLSLFSGIGAFEKALENLEIQYSLVNYCEIDKFASYAYNIIHNVAESYNLGDITKVNAEKLNDFDLLTHGSPCQSFSLAGKGEGGDEGSGTKSSLMWHSVNIIKHKMPKYVIWENVAAVTSKKHRHNFDKYLKTLSELGYDNSWKILNSKDYGSAQNRERVFVVSIRKDIYKIPFEFSQRNHKESVMRDILEKDVDEKYYISNSYIHDLVRELEKKLNKENKITKNMILKLGNINNPKALKMNNRVFSKDSVSPTLMTSSSEVTKIVDCRIRKLTPLECWRLMGFGEDYTKVKKSLEEKFHKGKDMSDSQMYKMAGNSIVVSVVESFISDLLI
ncbi:DNA cytosine methyltransferase [Clostridium sp. 19966]|uniref:DNA cytosine methyltransferase n=1 Tax=Clostridium sp. 19966 TaxID=2768166 RepID=UPI0028DEE52F|nr:DNA cytosine methyltransferase [Clostridium sp. 19966]MDT8715455.1 DNA cytosine methyltransferase [Clostridium sp. 19966]